MIKMERQGGVSGKTNRKLIITHDWIFLIIMNCGIKILLIKQIYSLISNIFKQHLCRNSINIEVAIALCSFYPQHHRFVGIYFSSSSYSIHQDKIIFHQIISELVNLYKKEILVYHNYQFDKTSMTSFQQNTSHKNQHNGRWTKKQAEKFEQLLDKYGKNWKEIQLHLKGRTLSQIRSHAQKFFAKVGPKRVAFYERKANILFVQKILKQQKCFQQEHKELQKSLEKQAKMIMMNEHDSSPSNSSAEDQTITQSPQAKERMQSEFIKEQIFKTPVIKEKKEIAQVQYVYPIAPTDMSFFMFCVQTNQEQSNEYKYGSFGSPFSNFRPYAK